MNLFRQLLAFLFIEIAVVHALEAGIQTELIEADNGTYTESVHHLSKRAATCSYTVTLYQNVLKSRSVVSYYDASTSYRGWCWKWSGGFRCTKYRTVTRSRTDTQYYYARESYNEERYYYCHNGGTCSGSESTVCNCLVGWADNSCSTRTYHRISLSYSSLSTKSAHIQLITSYYPLTPNALPILNYIATIKDLTFGETKSQQKITNSHRFHIELSLLPYRNYMVYASATNYPTTSISNTVSFLTLTAKPTSAPNDFTAIALNTITIGIVWSAPDRETRNGIVTGYNILYKRIDEAQEHSIAVSVTWHDISLLEEYTQYSIKVAAVNSAGIGEYTTKEIVRTLEGVPTGYPQVSFISRTSTSISLLLRPPSDLDQLNGIIKRYVVKYYSKISHSEIKYLPVMISANLLLPKITNITGLEEGVVYVISVNMHTSIGGGPYFNHLEVSTLESAPSGPPRNVHFEIHTTSLNISWSPPELLLQNGIITSYLVEYHGMIVDMDERDFTTDKLTAVITGLEEGVPYEISICANTVIGVGPCSTTRLTTQEVLPGEPPNNLEVEVDGSTDISITWNGITKEEENGVITSYHVIVTGQGFDDSTREIYTNSSNTYYSIKSLQEAHSYGIKVAAVNSAGIGPYSNETTAATEESPPSAAPRGITGIPTSSIIVLVWEDPDPIHRNGEITQYEIEYVGTTLDRTKRYVIVDEKSLLLRGLYEGERYQFRVRAYTEEGAGPYSRIHYTTTLETPPGLPTNVSVITISSTRIRVIWYEPLPADRNGVITGYDLLIAGNGDTEGTEIGIRELVRTYTLGNLIAGTRYLIQVRARNGAGPGPYSQPVLAETNLLHD